MGAAMKMCEGNIEAADYMLDTTVYNWFYRMQQKAKYGKWMEKQMKDLEKKTR